MARRNEPLEATLDELRKAGYHTPHVAYGKHIKVKCEGLPVIIVSISASDTGAVHQAVRMVRKILAQRSVDVPAPKCDTGQHVNKP